MTIVVVILFDSIISKMLKLQPEMNNKNVQDVVFKTNLIPRVFYFPSSALFNLLLSH